MRRQFHVQIGRPRRPWLRMRLQAHELRTRLPSHVLVADTRRLPSPVWCRRLQSTFAKAGLINHALVNTQSIFGFRMFGMRMVSNLVVMVASGFLAQRGFVVRLKRFLVRIPTSALFRSWIQTILVWYANSSNKYHTLLVPFSLKDLRC
ncbi:unnamed protein product [Schistosoma mattheei]|uniref:Uncharacterized protein n=1 Tax=Schistosoma mattheei TaxID=31246 RepID=A0A183Q0H3_9TREM|nr:unnamed protein product [Schistosoma mattheei]